MQISENFWLSELIDSNTATRLNIPNQPNHTEIENLRALTLNILQPVRSHYGKPVIISSGYRSESLNETIGGSVFSQHIKGEAADFEIPGVDNRDVCQWIMENVVFDQLILEFFSKTEGKNSGWIHASYSRHRNRGDCLVAYKDGGTRYIRVDNFLSVA